MTSASIPPPIPLEDAALRRAARTLIAATLGELVDQDQDWLGACRKRIKDRMSNAKHIIFNNERKIGMLLLGRTDDIPALETRNRQLEQAARVCGYALDLLDEMVNLPPALTPASSKPVRKAGLGRRPATSIRREPTTSP